MVTGLMKYGISFLEIERKRQGEISKDSFDDVLIAAGFIILLTYFIATVSTVFHGFT